MAEPQFALCPACHMRHGVPDPDRRSGTCTELVCAGCGEAWRGTHSTGESAEAAQRDWNATHKQPYREWVREMLAREREKVQALNEGRWR